MTAFPGLSLHWQLDAYRDFDGKWVGTAYLPRWGGIGYRSPLLAYDWKGIESTRLLTVGSASENEARALVSCFIVMATQKTVRLA